MIARLLRALVGARDGSDEGRRREEEEEYRGKLFAGEGLAKVGRVLVGRLLGEAFRFGLRSFGGVKEGMRSRMPARRAEGGC